VGATNGGMNMGSAAGAYEVHGAIGAHYGALGGSGSVLGYPTTDETATPDGVGRYNHFEAGSIYWTPSTGAYEVHGLIRQFWAEHGWERNASLGYPISDELIPDRRIGHRHPERLRKPILDLPADVIKLPADATRVGFSPLVSNVPPDVLRRPTAAETSSPVASGADPRVMAATTGARSGPERVLGVAEAAALAPRSADGSSSPAPDQSQNRFGDFESGVLFWRRGAAAAQQLQPWPKSGTGDSMRRSAAEVIQAMQATLSAALGHVSGASMAGLSFAGTTGYVWDGVAVRNRRHRVMAGLMVTQHVTGPFGIGSSIPAQVEVELQLEVSFEPLNQLANVCLADWTFTPAIAIDASPPIDQQLHQQLDPLLFHQVMLIDLPDTDDGRPIAILSVKTMPNGDVVIFVEPSGLLLTGVIAEASSAALSRTLTQERSPIPQ
jgi:hypothetical protein